MDFSRDTFLHKNICIFGNSSHNNTYKVLQIAQICDIEQKYVICGNSFWNELYAKHFKPENMFLRFRDLHEILKIHKMNPDEEILICVDEPLDVDKALLRSVAFDRHMTTVWTWSEFRFCPANLRRDAHLMFFADSLELEKLKKNNCETFRAECFVKTLQSPHYHPLSPSLE